MPFPNDITLYNPLVEFICASLTGTEDAIAAIEDELCSNYDMNDEELTYLNEEIIHPLREALANSSKEDNYMIAKELYQSLLDIFPMDNDYDKTKLWIDCAVSVPELRNMLDIEEEEAYVSSDDEDEDEEEYEIVDQFQYKIIKCMASIYYYNTVAAKDISDTFTDDESTNNTILNIFSGLVSATTTQLENNPDAKDSIIKKFTTKLSTARLLVTNGLVPTENDQIKALNNEISLLVDNINVSTNGPR